MASWFLPALFASVVAIGITLAIEHLGSRRGGLVGTLPSTIVPASLGLAAVSASVGDFQDALWMTPAGMLINALFLLCWRELPPRLPPLSSRIRLMICTVVSLLLWAVMATLSILLFPAAQSFGIGAASLSVGLFITGIVLGVVACTKNPPVPNIKARIRLTDILTRGLLAGAAIGTSVWLANNAAPLIAGVAAVFPALFLTAMVTLWISHDETVGAGAVGPMMLGGTSVSAFALIATWSMPALGAWPGAAVAWVLAVCTITVPSWAWLNHLSDPSGEVRK